MIEIHEREKRREKDLGKADLSGIKNNFSLNSISLLDLKNVSLLKEFHLGTTLGDLTKNKLKHQNLIAVEVTP